MAEKETESTFTRASKQFSTIAQDLFNIEVNIILRNNISAQKMPNPRHALLDIGKEYCAALEGMEMNRQDYNRDPNAKSLFFEEADMFEMMRQDLGFMTGDEFDERLRSKSVFDEVDEDKVVSHKVGSELGGFDAFDVLRTWADSLIDDENKNKFLDPAQLAVLPRIKDNADLIKGMYSAFCRRDPNLNDPNRPEEENLEKLLAMREAESRISPNTIVKLSKQIDYKRTIDLTNEYSRSDLVNRDDIEPLPIRESDLMSIRKIWELGTEVIAMQTIVQIDGDVITRLNPNFLDETKYPRLHDYHNKGVNIALAHWSTLVNVAKELIVATVRGISGSLGE